MTKRRSRQSVWNAGTLINILTIPLLTGGIVAIGFYYTTSTALTQHTQQIQEETKARQTEVKDEAAQRDRLRDTLVTNSQETQKAISSLAATAAVQNEQIKSITGSLDRVVSGLQTLSAAKR
jgi:seryl-tRNA synthetase